MAAPLYNDPYADAMDDLPEYPLSSNDGGVRAAPRRFFGRGGAQDGEEDAAPLIKAGRREGEPIPLDIDGFAYELGRVHHDVDAFRDAVHRLAALKAQVLALDAEDTTLVAQSLLADLAVQTAATSRLFKDLPTQLRAFGDKVAFLKPGAGRFLVTNAESTPLKGELAVCCATLRTVVLEVRTLAEVEDKEKQQARVRLLKAIKAQMGPSGDDAQVMAALLTAEREGSSLYAEQLKAGSPSWRWAVERPFTRLNVEVDKAGDLSFLSRVEAIPTSSAALWLNPLAYVPAVFKSRSAAAADPQQQPQPPGCSSRSFLGSARTGRAASAGFAALPDLDGEDRVGSYGEALDAPPRTAPSKWARVALAVFVLAAVGGSAVAVALWTKHRNDMGEAQDQLLGGLE